ncbi:MAG: 6-carboxytetrahydropterin synthase [Actinobacteria bacterium]|nr:6-carboxytetrahydropterin synthase [Actinomycetota bacterium]
MFRICKTFEFESGHVLSKSMDRCRFPHGHSRRVELVLASEQLDEHDMVCDFKWIKLALQDILGRLDHAMCINQSDPRREHFNNMGAKIELFQDRDPTSEVIARLIFDHLQAKLDQRMELTGPEGSAYRVPAGLSLERVRLWETSTSWAEYSI